MELSKKTIRCRGCRALVLDTAGPTHRYVGASPGCWQLYGEVLAREYSNVRFAAVHGLTVDCYAVQHPGTPSPQTIRSVARHLIRLHLVLEREFDPRQATRAMQNAGLKKGDLKWLEPPASPGSTTVLDVRRAADPIEHRDRVLAWSRSVWQAWTPHHATVRRWADS
ncbi:MAG: hypothetical protein JSV80_02175 [Acidobacteriota bacterium]|nr:MAG: hypothetical protein JSV80_02175 [Acidobacteriota bacterium]